MSDGKGGKSQAVASLDAETQPKVAGGGATFTDLPKVRGKMDLALSRT